MTSPVASGDAVPQAQVDGRRSTLLSGAPLRRLIAMTAVAAVGWSLPNTASATLAQALVADRSPEHKVALFAVVSTVGAISAMVCNVVCGGRSDRTRSRFGRRTPWIVGGAVVATAGLLLAAATSLFVLLVIGNAIFQGGLNACVAALNAVTPDRVPTERLGTASAVTGFGYLLGLVAGAGVASALIDSPALGLAIVPWFLVLCAVLFVTVARDRPSLDDTAPPRPWRELAPPREHDFLLAFAGRFLTLLALLLFSVYGLFIATDYLDLTKKHGSEVVALGTLLLGVGAVVSTIIGGVLSDRIGRRKPLVVFSSCLIAVGAVPILISPTIPALFAFTFIAGVGYGAYLSVDAALMVEVLPRADDAGKDLGFLTLANTAPVVVAPALAGGIVTLIGYRALFVALVLCALAGALCILRIRKVR